MTKAQEKKIKKKLAMISPKAKAAVQMFSNGSPAKGMTIKSLSKAIR